MDETCEETRVALLSCTNTSGDVIIAAGIASIQANMQRVQNEPQSVVSTALGGMSIGSLQSLGNIAGMGNQPTTVTAFAKHWFAADFRALNSKISELGYLKVAQISAAEAALNAQYFVGAKTDMPKFREDVQKALTQNAGNIGFNQGAAAANAAPAGGDVPMGG